MLLRTAIRPERWLLSIFKWCQRNSPYYFRQSVFRLLPPLQSCCHSVTAASCFLQMYLPRTAKHPSPFALSKNFYSKNTPSFVRLRFYVILVLLPSLLVPSLCSALVCYAFRQSAVVLFLNLMTQLIDCYLEENNTRHRHCRPPSCSGTSTNLMDIVWRRRASWAFGCQPKLEWERNE